MNLFSQIIDDHFQLISNDLSTTQEVHSQIVEEKVNQESIEDVLQIVKEKINIDSAEDKRCENQQKIVEEKNECSSCKDLRFKNKCLLGVVLLTCIFYFKKK